MRFEELHNPPNTNREVQVSECERVSLVHGMVVSFDRIILSTETNTMVKAEKQIQLSQKPASVSKMLPAVFHLL